MLSIPDVVPEPDPVDGLISRAYMARYLLGLMAGDFSDSYYFVSWTKELPFDLWAAAHGEEVEGPLGPVNLSAEERKLILELACVADGWWVYEDETRPGEGTPVFIPMDRWVQVLAPPPIILPNENTPFQSRTQ